MLFWCLFCCCDSNWCKEINIFWNKIWKTGNTLYCLHCTFYILIFNNVMTKCIVKENNFYLSNTSITFLNTVTFHGLIQCSFVLKILYHFPGMKLSSNTNSITWAHDSHQLRICWLLHVSYLICNALPCTKLLGSIIPCLIN